MNTPKVSVVIPCYNVENYLRQCLDSVVGQTLKDMEIICVNDGSKDGTLSILQEYAAADPRVRIIDKPNGGYGESMNRGFDAATGEYLGIVESDDYADPEMFQSLYDCAKTYDLDVVKAGFYYYYSKPEERNVPCPIASRVTSQRTFTPLTGFQSKMEMVEFFNIKPTIWSAIYRRDFIRANHIRFHETPGASYQDASFNFKVWVCAQRVRLLPQCFLHYRQDNEASSVNDPGKVYCICDEYDEMERFLLEHPVERAAVEPVMVRIKYDSYNWNYLRLSEPLQKEFIQRFHDDFQKHQLDGTLQQQYFEWYKWNTIQQILEDPQKYHDRHLRQEKGERVEEWNALPADDRPWLVRKLLGAVRCVRDHGLVYTLRLLVKKIAWRFGK